MKEHYNVVLTFFGFFLWMIMISGEPDLIDGIVHYLMKP